MSFYQVLAQPPTKVFANFQETFFIGHTIVHNDPKPKSPIKKIANLQSYDTMHPCSSRGFQIPAVKVRGEKNIGIPLTSIIVKSERCSCEIGKK